MSTPYKIEKNVPIMKAIKKKDRSIYPFADMSIGDSFLVPKAHLVKNAKNKTTPSKKMSSLVQAFVKKSSGSGKKFSIRTTPEGSVRVWRTQ